MATVPRPFDKKASTPQQLLEKLERQGLTVGIAQRALALDYLRFVGGYRLKGYWHHLVDPVTKVFPSGYRFEQLAARYEFDRELRALTIDAIERLEIAVRTAMADYLSISHSPHWFLDARLFRDDKQPDATTLVDKIRAEVVRAQHKTFVQHYFEHYSDPPLPPSWSVCECVTFGLWSRTFKLLRDPNDRKAISRRFGVDPPEVFESWLHTLTVVRNLVAHNAQLLRITLGVAPRNFRRAGILFDDAKSFYAAATVMRYLIGRVNLPHSWHTGLETLFERYPGIDIAEIGFPSDWQIRPGWRG